MNPYKALDTIEHALAVFIIAQGLLLFLGVIFNVLPAISLFRIVDLDLIAWVFGGLLVTAGVTHSLSFKLHPRLRKPALLAYVVLICFYIGILASVAGMLSPSLVLYVFLLVVILVLRLTD